MGFAVAVAAFAAATHVQAAPMQNEAVVRGVRGTANYSTDGANWRDLKVGAKLRQNSVVRTAPGAVVDLFLGDNGPVVRLMENTTLELEKLTVDRSGVERVIETMLDLRSGRILGHVKPLAAASKYEVKTPQGVAGIRGTRYDISADGRVSLTEGEAVVVYVIGGQTSTATIREGQTVRPPTQAGAQPPVVPLPPSEAQTINNLINDAARRPSPEAPTGVQQSVLTLTPVLEQIQGGDRAKIETVIEGHVDVTPGNAE